MTEPLSAERVKPVQMLRASHQIAKQIEDMIVSGVLKPGNRLPGERTLAKRFQTSRNPLREAVRALEALGYVTVKPGIGTFVADTSDLSALKSHLGQAFSSQKEKFEESLTIHRALFAEAAYLAATKRTNEQIREAQSALEEQETALKSNDKTGLLYSDWVITSAIADMSGSSMLRQMVPESMDYVKDTRASLFALPMVSHAEDSVTEHRAILAAIADGNSSEASAQARHHIVSTFLRWIALQGDNVDEI